jgi:3-oxoacyl-[acyl-carrier-protein] synthase-3
MPVIISLMHWKSSSKENNLGINDLDYIIPHQANMRIMDHIAHSLQIPGEKMLSNIETLGNTGCASTLIAIDQNKDKMISGKKIGFTVFGGGYSTGSMLMEF